MKCFEHPADPLQKAFFHFNNASELVVCSRASLSEAETVLGGEGPKAFNAHRSDGLSRSCAAPAAPPSVGVLEDCSVRVRLADAPLLDHCRQRPYIYLL